MRNLALLVAGLSLSGIACTPAPITRAKIGAVCAADGDCETGTMCKMKLCTKPCSQQGGDLHPADGNAGGCPVGFDCGIAVVGDAIPTCYAQTYNTAMNGYLLDCSTYAEGCGQAMNPCSTSAPDGGTGFECFAPTGLACDPGSYCTTTGCMLDTDCPPTMFCGTDAKDGTTRRCLKRGDCTDCATDDQCPTGFICATDGKGAHHCQQTCNASTDCPAPQYGSPFAVCLVDKSGKGKVCTPGDGYCTGPSAIMGFPDTQICAGCRIGSPGDCTNGTKCYRDDFTTERFCTQACMVTINMQGVVTKDTCPTSSYCAVGPVEQAGTYNGICSAASDYAGPTCYPN